MQIQAFNPSNIVPNAFIALGSNQSSTAGTPINALIHSLKLFSGESLEIVSQSSWYQSPAFPAGSGPDYINAVVGVKTSLDSVEILAALHRIEHDLGRSRKTRWAARSCDLDLLACGAEIQPNIAGFQYWLGLDLAKQQTIAPSELILPHPRLQDRSFVLVPFGEIAPDWQHPVLCKTVAEMLAELAEAEIATLRKISAH